MIGTKQQFPDTRRTSSRINVPLPKRTLTPQAHIIHSTLKTRDKEERMKVVERKHIPGRGIIISHTNDNRLLMRNYARQRIMK